jgi:hypothetical protein
MSKIQHGITKYNHQLLMLPSEAASKRLIARFSDHAFSDPLPELSLCGPELLAIATDHQGSPFLFLLIDFLLRAHILLLLPPFGPALLRQQL